jgi:DNA-directed RNA polymerase subunit A'
MKCYYCNCCWNSNDENIEKLKELVRRGAEYPGANYIVRPDGRKKKITEELKEELVNELVPGYKVKDI